MHSGDHSFEIESEKNQFSSHILLFLFRSLPHSFAFHGPRISSGPIQAHVHPQEVVGWSKDNEFGLSHTKTRGGETCKDAGIPG